jgi:tRNA A37 threonylcarbamoyladenosine dehydratase
MPDEPAVLPDLERRFGAAARLLGEAAYARLRAAHAVVIGIGGVGSWAAEALARCGLAQLTLIDLDHVAESNTNRQIHALDEHYGKAKVQAMRERVAAIHPACHVHAVEEFITPHNVATLVPPADVVLDCIDQARAKAALIAHCRDQRQWVITAGAAGGKLDPTRIRVGDLALVHGDPLLARVRSHLRRAHGFPAADQRGGRFDVPAAYSDEPVHAPSTAMGTPGAPLACAGYGSLVTVTAPLGFVLAARAVQHIVAHNSTSPPSA